VEEVITGSAQHPKIKSQSQRWTPPAEVS
jgi:hypothetical protein